MSKNDQLISLGRPDASCAPLHIGRGISAVRGRGREIFGARITALPPGMKRGEGGREDS